MALKYASNLFDFLFSISFPHFLLCRIDWGWAEDGFFWDGEER
jgi:hypothetical protein